MSHEITTEREPTERTERVPGIYWIPERNLESLTTVIDRLSRRAAKLASEPIALVLTGEERFTEHKDGARRWTTKEIQVRLTGSSPRLNGWRFAAALTHDAETGRNVLRGMGGELPERFRTAGAYCEHCKLDRNRKDTYVVAHDDGRWAQVGRQCLKDFTGHADPHGYAMYAEMLATAIQSCSDAEGDEWEGSSGRYRVYWPLEEVVAMALACIREYGWTAVSEEGPGRPATKANVESLLNPSNQDREAADKWCREKVTEEEYKTAGTVIAYCLEMKADSDYLWNLQTIAVQGRVDRKTLGLACSMPRCYSRELARRAERLQAADSKWFGTKGERARYVLTVTDTREYPGDYGVTTMVKLVDAEGNRAKWWASGVPELEIGKEYTVKATVKDHGEWKGVKETQLSRVAVMTEEEVAAEVAKEARKQARAERAARKESKAALNVAA